MVTLTETIPHNTAYLRVIGDIHKNDKHFTNKSKEILQNDIEWIRRRDNARAFLNGDLFNTPTRTSKTSPFDASNEDEFKELVDLLSPIADKIIGITDGNHEQRLTDFANHSLTNILARELRTYYCGNGCLLFLKVGESWKQGRGRAQHTYANYIQHTSGGGSTTGSKVNSAIKSENVIAGCDVYYGNHTHLKGANGVRTYVANPNNCTITEIETRYISCGSYLDYGGYAEQKQYRPMSLGTPIVQYDGTGKHKKINISL